ncbi:hypothetical protein ABW21_db0207131 [Orbilia brochopaga]|nr:hypothetical protein ABW21_db0207131 [Drechslerella brochopaga]
MVQNNSERDAFNLKDGQMFAGLRKDFPLGTQFSLIAVSPDGRSTIHSSDKLKPFETNLYNDDAKSEAIAAITIPRKRPYPDLPIFPLPSLRGPGADDSASGAGRARKKQKRGSTEPTPLADAVPIASSSSSSSASASSSSSSFPVPAVEPEIELAEQQVALLPAPPEELSDPNDEVQSQSLDKGKGKATATDLENMNSSTSEERIGEGLVETEERSIALRIGDTEAVTNYLVSRFVQIQQLDCRALAKSWIKAVEPRKQSHSPYNKGDLTRPYWWPARVPHREPDHLLRSHRVEVLVSILRSTGIEMAELRAATNGARGVRTRQKELLSEVCDVVGLERRFSKGQLDQDHIVYVVPFTKLTKRKPRAPKAGPAPAKVTKPPRQPRRLAGAAAATRRRRVTTAVAAAADLPQVKEEDQTEFEAGSSQQSQALTLASTQPQQVVLVASSSRTVPSPAPQTQSVVKRRPSADAITTSLSQAVERHTPVSDSRSPYDWTSPDSAVSASYALSHPHSPLSALQVSAPESAMLTMTRPSMFTPTLMPHMPSAEVPEFPLQSNDPSIDFGVPSDQYNGGDAYIGFALTEGTQFHNINYQNPYNYQ